MDKLPEGIRRHRSGFIVDVTEAGVRKRLTVPTLKEATQLRAVMRAELVAANVTKRGKTLKDAYDQAMIERWSRSKSDHSRQQTLLNAGQVLDFFGPDTPIGGINRGDIAAFDEYLRQQGNSDATINRKHAPLSTMLTIAEQHGWIERRPYIQHLREGKGRIRWLSHEEERLILGQFEQWGMDDHAAVMIVLLDTGVRNGELWELSVNDCDLMWVDPETGDETGLITIWHNKTDLPRTLPLTDRARHVLLRRKVHAVNGKLFPYDNVWFRRMWDRAKMVVGIKDDTLVPYCCRHTCATRLLQKGYNLRKLQEWLGHTSIQMTMRYSHLNPTALVGGAKLLEKGVTCDRDRTGGVSRRDRHLGGIGRVMDSGEVESTNVPSRVGITNPNEYGG